MIFGHLIVIHDVMSQRTYIVVVKVNNHFPDYKDTFYTPTHILNTEENPYSQV